MAILVDTNVLIFSIQASHPWQEASIKAIEKLLTTEESVFVLWQNLAEFWNVCTRPLDKNGLGLAPDEAAAQLDRLSFLFTIIFESAEGYAQWRNFVVEHQVRGIQVHDARIAAAMRTQASAAC